MGAFGAARPTAFPSRRLRESHRSREHLLLDRCPSERRVGIGREDRRRACCSDHRRRDRNRHQPREQRPTPDGVAPAPKRAPAIILRRTEAPEPAADLALTFRPAAQQQPEPDRPCPEVAPSGDAPRHHRDHGPTAEAPVATDFQNTNPSNAVGLERAAYLSVSQPVPDELDAPSEGPRSHRAPGTACWPHPLGRRQLLRPKLDLNLRMNDTTLARRFAQ